MEIVEEDKNKEKILLRINKKEDLFYLKEIIREEDLVEGIAFRKIKLDSGKNIVKKGRVKLKVDHTSLENERLRIIGEITEGPEEFPRAHQAINISNNDEICLYKKLNAYEKKLLKDSVEKSKTNILTICFDREKAIYYKLKNRNYSKIHEKSLGTQGKGYNNKGISDNKLFEKINEPIKTTGSLNYKNFEGIIYASNSFWKEPWKKNTDKEIRKKSTYIITSSVESSINEVLKRSEIKTVFKDIEIQKNHEILQEVLKRISKDKKIAYGEKEVKKNIDMGAVDKLIVSSFYMKKKRENESINDLINLFEKVDKMDGEFIIMDSNYETGKTIDSFTGIVALTRFDIN